MVTRGQVEAFVGRAYGLVVLRSLVELPQGVHSKAWLAHTDTDDWVIKVSDPGADSPAALSAQAELYRFLNSRGLHTPEVRADRSGQHVSIMETQRAALPGHFDAASSAPSAAPESVSGDDVRHVATQVARLHATMDEFGRRDEIVADREKSREEWGRQVTGCFPDLIRSPTGGCFSAAERSWFRVIDGELVAFLGSYFPDPASLSEAVLHGDLSFEHVRLLATGDAYFFDFGDMCWGPVAHELAQFLRGFRDASISFERWAQLRSWVLEGYRSGQVFTATDAAAIDVFILNRVVAVSKYILELNPENPSAAGAQAIKSAYRLAEAVLRKRHLSKN